MATKQKTKMSKVQAEKVLGLTGTYDLKTLKKTYRKLVSQNHPDANSTNGSHQKMVEINEAKAVLTAQFNKDKNAKIECGSPVDYKEVYDKWVNNNPSSNTSNTSSPAGSTQHSQTPGSASDRRSGSPSGRRQGSSSGRRSGSRVGSSAGPSAAGAASSNTQSTPNSNTTTSPKSSSHSSILDDAANDSEFMDWLKDRVEKQKQQKEEQQASVEHQQKMKNDPVYRYNNSPFTQKTGFLRAILLLFILPTICGMISGVLVLTLDSMTGYLSNSPIEVIMAIPILVFILSVIYSKRLAMKISSMLTGVPYSVIKQIKQRGITSKDELEEEE